jgi:threonine/homoserine/homoserine lactone efflux protein
MNMSYVPQLLTIAGVMLLACISPGPDILAVTSHALSRRSAGLGVATGIATSHLTWATLAVFGLGVIVSQLTWLYKLIRLAGALYVFFLGFRMLIGLRKSDVSAVIGEAFPLNVPRAFQKGLLVGLTNRKPLRYYFAVTRSGLGSLLYPRHRCGDIVFVVLYSRSLVFVRAIPTRIPTFAATDRRSDGDITCRIERQTCV